MCFPVFFDASLNKLVPMMLFTNILSGAICTIVGCKIIFCPTAYVPCSEMSYAYVYNTCDLNKNQLNVAAKTQPITDSGLYLKSFNKIKIS